MEEKKCVRKFKQGKKTKNCVKEFTHHYHQFALNVLNVFPLTKTN